MICSFNDDQSTAIFAGVGVLNSGLVQAQEERFPEDMMFNQVDHKRSAFNQV